MVWMLKSRHSNSITVVVSGRGSEKKPTGSPLRRGVDTSQVRGLQQRVKKHIVAKTHKDAARAAEVGPGVRREVLAFSSVGFGGRLAALACAESASRIVP